MDYTGVLVRLRPDAWAPALASIAALGGVEIHQREAATGRAVLVLEAEDLAGSKALLEAVRRVPGVLLAEPVYLYPDDGAGDPPSAPPPPSPASAPSELRSTS